MKTGKLEELLPLLLDLIIQSPVGENGAGKSTVLYLHTIGNGATILWPFLNKRNLKNHAITAVKNHLEDRLDHDLDSFNQLIGDRLLYLPGNSWPEKELIEETLRNNNLDPLINVWEGSKEDISAFLEQALTAGKHNEFYNLANSLCLPLPQVRADVIKNYKYQHKDTITEFVAQINRILEDV